LRSTLGIRCLDHRSFASSILFLVSRNTSNLSQVASAPDRFDCCSSPAFVLACMAMQSTYISVAIHHSSEPAICISNPDKRVILLRKAQKPLRTSYYGILHHFAYLILSDTAKRTRDTRNARESYDHESTNQASAGLLISPRQTSARLGQRYSRARTLDVAAQFPLFPPTFRLSTSQFP